MFGITDLDEYIIGDVAVILLSGSNSMYCLTMTEKYGAKRAYCAIAGILLSDSTLMLFSALGATTSIKTIPVLFLTLKEIGGLYLGYLGCGQLREAIYKWRLPYVFHPVFKDNSMPETKIVKAITNFSIF
jgi:leucine efflux protein